MERCGDCGQEIYLDEDTDKWVDINGDDECSYRWRDEPHRPADPDR